MMKKILAASVIVLVLLSFSFLMLGCEKKECEKSSDCTAPNKCFTARCLEGVCKPNPKDDCCGNNKCEADGGENKCFCPDDCGKCGGKVKYNVTTSRGSKSVEAKYAQFLCDESKQCVIAAAEADINILKLSNIVDETGAFKAEILSTINQPYNTAIDSVEIRVKLTDLNEKVLSGITFTSLQILSGSTLLGEKMIKNNLAASGEIFTESLTLSSPQKLVEEEKTLDVKIDYEYVVNERGIDDTKRSSKKARLSDKITVISP